MEKDNIIHIITRLEPGGSTQNTVASCLYQSKYYRVILIAGAGFTPTEKLPDNFKLITLPSLSRELSFFKDIKAFKDIYSVISKYKPKIVHTHTSKAGILGRWGAAFHNLINRKEKTIIVHTPHGHVFYGYFGLIKTFIFKQIEKITAKLTDYFIALTYGERNESAHFGIGNKKKWTVIHSGVRFNTNLYPKAKAEFEFAEGEIIIGTVARLEYVKGIEYFVRAAGELLRKKLPITLKFLVIGGGEFKDSLIKLAQDEGLGDKIIFTGFQADVYKSMAAMDIYIQPSLNEAMGRTIIQAQYMKLPVIASKVCGIRDLIEEGENGFLIAPKDYKALANATETLIKDSHKRRQLGENAQKFIMEKDYTGYGKFSEHSMNIKLKDFYDKILPYGNN